MSNCEVNIRFSDDELVAYADFFPAQGDGAELTDLYVKGVIRDIGICRGTNWDLVIETINICNETRKPATNVEIARGDRPVSEVPPHWNLIEKFFRNAMRFEANALKVDFHEVSKFIMVKKGQLIAKKNDGRNGIPGKTVKNKEIPFKKKNIIQFSAGKNTKEYQNHLYAATSGRYEVTEKREIVINDVLHVEGNVDYSTGNISFGKDVIIDGEIKDGFKVAAGGALYCKSNMDASDVLCRKDLIVDKGIIGRGLAIVRVGGSITATFVENCHVESQTGIIIDKNIMNSQIYTLGELKLGEKGALVSSVIVSEHGVEAYNIGKPGSPDSTINCGYSFVEQRSLDAIKQRVEVLKEKLGRLERLPEYRKTDKKMALIAQMKGVIQRSKNEYKKKEGELYKVKDAVVYVHGTIYPGNTVIICGVQFRVIEEKSKVKFYLNAASNRIETSPLY